MKSSVNSFRLLKNVSTIFSFGVSIKDEPIRCTMTSLTEAQKKYLTYTLTYDGTPYTQSQTGLSNSLPFASGSNTKTVKVRVEYIQPEASADLPQAAVDVTLTASLDYEQAA